MTAGVLVGVISTQATAQRSVTVAPGPEYGASETHEWFFGAGYRDLWQTPVRVPVLDIGTYAGGLKPVKAGGGKQTRTLHLHGKDGRQYVFRSVNKDAARALPEGLDALPIGSVAQDLTAVFNPSGAVMVPPLLRAVSVLHVSPRLYMMPDDPRLGEHLEAFGSTLGYLEERPEEGAGSTSGFAGANEIVGEEKLLETLREDSRNRVDERDRLAARLIDILVGDTDRGTNQWRWARFKDGDSFRWRPIPRDRDFAFIKADGLIPRIVSTRLKRLARFQDELPPLNVLTFSSMYEDRLFLQSLDGAAWAAIAEDVKQKLSDSVIENAVRAMPPEHYALVGEEIAAKLRMRRDALPDIARELYEKMAAFVDVHASDRSELAEIRRSSDGGVELRIYHGGPEQVASVGNGAILPVRRPFYERRFVPAETEEVRIYLHGGDDRVLIEGPNMEDAIAVRIIAGDGRDELVDLSLNGDGGTHSWFYDDSDDLGHATRGRHTHFDRRSFTEPDGPPHLKLIGDPWRFRDWGKTSGYRPSLDFRDNTGFIVGVEYGTREYGFRRTPFRSQGRAKLLYAPGAAAFGAEMSGEGYFENSPFSVAGTVRASGYDDLRFHGYGNDSPDIESDSSLVELGIVHASAGLRYGRGDTRVALGGNMEIRDTPTEDGTPLATIRPLGIGEWTQYGIWTTAETAFGRHASFAVDAAYHPVGGSLTEAYAKGRGEAVVRIGSVPELALRAIGEKIWGDAPFHDAAFIGGRKLLRGYSFYRFVGDASVTGNAELRIPAFDHFTVFLLGDAGRVYVDGESPGGWHTAYGGGVTYSVAEHAINAIYANGEGHKFYVTLGRTF